MVDALVVMRMGPANTTAHLSPLAAAIHPGKLYVVRPAPRPDGLVASNIYYREVKGRWRPIQVLRTLVAALRTSRLKNIDVILSFNAFPYGVIAALCGMTRRKPFHVGFVGSDLRAARGRPWWIGIIRRASFITTPGENFNRAVASLGYANKVFQLAHGVDGDRFRPAGGRRDIDVLYVGALLPRKRVSLLLQAFGLLQAHRPEIRAVLIGDGPLRRELEALSRTLGIETLIEFAGHQGKPEQWMRRARLLLLASEWEGLPYAMIEAMRCGTVPVTTAVGSIKELVKHGQNGILVPDPSPERFAAAISDLLAHTSIWEKLSAAAVESTSDLTYEHVAEAWRRIIDETSMSHGERP